jgi:predicted kinase
MSILYLFVGPIASGKSTLAKAMARKGACVVNDDSFTMAVHAGQYDQYDAQLKPIYKGLENAVILPALAMGRDVVIDRPLHSRSTRRRYIELARSIDAPAVVIQFKRERPLVHATRRMNDDARGHDLDYWNRVCEIHEGLFQPVIADEGYDNIIPSELALGIIYPQE